MRPILEGIPVLEVSTRLGLAVSAVTLVPCALLIALSRFAPWPPHWLEAVVLFGLPVACVPVFALQASSTWRNHWWAGLVALAACWFLLSPYVTANGQWIVGYPARSLAAEIELLAYGHFAWSPNRGAWAVTAAVAAIAAVSILTWYAMLVLQWIGDRVAARAPAAPVTKLADAEWASRGEVRRRFSTDGGIVLGEITDPRGADQFDPDDQANWGRQGKGRLITLDPSKGNAHTLVFSGSGSYKTAGVAIPNALTYAGPLVIIDPKGEIHDLTAPVREARDRQPWRITVDAGLDAVKLLTAVRPGDGGVFSDIAEWLLPTTGSDKSDSAAFFHQKSVRLLGALLAHLHHAKTKGNLFAAANRILSLSTEAELREDFRAYAETYADKKDCEYIAAGLAEVAKTEERQLSGVVATVANGLDWAGKSSTRGFLESEDDGDALLARLLDAQTDVYIVISTPIIQAVPGIARALIGAIVRAIRDSTPTSTPRDKLPHRLFIIDEARAMRRMDYLVGVRDEGRAHGIHLMQIFQSYQQLVESYGSSGAGAWENSVDAVVIGPVTNANQAVALSRMIGQKTVTTSSSARQRSSQLFMPFSGSSGSSETTQLRETDLIRPAELRQLPPEAAIILAPGTAPILASKAIWFTRPEMQALVQDAWARQSSDKDNEAADSVDDSVSLPAGGGTESVDETSASAKDAREPASNPPSESGPLPEPVDPLDGLVEEGRYQGSADSGSDNAVPEMPRQDQAARGAEEAETPDPGPSPDDRVFAVSEVSTKQTGDTGAEDQFEAKIGAAEEKETHSPVEHARSGPDGESQDVSASADEPEPADKTPSQPSIAPTATGRDAAAWALAQGWLVDPDETDDAPVSVCCSGDGPTSSEGEVMEMLRQDQAAHAAEEVTILDPGLSPDDGVSSASEAPAEPAGDPDVEDQSEEEIAVVEEDEAHSPREHAHPERVSEFQGASVTAEEKVTDSAGEESVSSATPDVDPDLGAAIVNRAVYDSIVTKATSLKASQVVDQVLADPSVEFPPGTQPRVIPPGVLGSGVEYADFWSLVFVPDDGRSPVHRTLFDKDGTIVGRVGPYHRA
ncbi:MAG: type IV secretory system conjugative DNA transfer family protein [Rhodobacteraceae bacterium]|nr:type IV secretory system conjugative DNA transfer family protein [Paracoccaceae bacterium]